MRIAVLGSGSGGNAIVVESDSKRLLIDAGFSCREIERRLSAIGVDRQGFDALVLTHEHSDHTKGVARFARRNKTPIYATEGTLQGLDLDTRFLDIQVIASGELVEIGDWVVEPFAVPHDAREPIGMVVEDRQGHRLGLVADLGSRSQLAWARLTDLDFLILESNHDLEMLRSGPYPWPLKERVAGRHGHLSNKEAAEGIGELDTGRMSWLVLYHLSRTNNLPALALQEAGEALSRQTSRAELCVTHQLEPKSWLELELHPAYIENLSCVGFLGSKITGRLRTSRTWGYMPFSTEVRRAPGSFRGMALESTSIGVWGRCPTSSAPKSSGACLEIVPSVTPDIRPLARAC